MLYCQFGRAFECQGVRCPNASYEKAEADCQCIHHYSRSRFCDAAVVDQLLHRHKVDWDTGSLEDGLFHLVHDAYLGM